MAHVYNAHDLNLQPPKDKKPKRKAKAAKKPDTSRPKSAPKAVAKTVAKAKAKAGAKAGVKEKSKKVKMMNLPLNTLQQNERMMNRLCRRNSPRKRRRTHLHLCLKLLAPWTR